MTQVYKHLQMTPRQIGRASSFEKSEMVKWVNMENEVALSDEPDPDYRSVYSLHKSTGQYTLHCELHEGFTEDIAVAIGGFYRCNCGQVFAYFDGQNHQCSECHRILQDF